MSSTYKIGDRVTPIAGDDRVPRESRGRVFIVAKVNPKNIKCSAEDGGRGINFPADLLTEATDKNIAAGNILGRPYEPPEIFHEGEIVTLKRAYQHITTETPMIVTKQGPKNVNLSPLGGSDRYMRCPPAGLVRRDLEWLAETLCEQVTA